MQDFNIGNINSGSTITYNIKLRDDKTHDWITTLTGYSLKFLLYDNKHNIKYQTNGIISGNLFKVTIPSNVTINLEGQYEISAITKDSNGVESRGNGLLNIKWSGGEIAWS